MDRAQEIGLFRWRVIVGEAADAVAVAAGARDAGARRWPRVSISGPDGRWVRVSRNTLDRWIRAYRRGRVRGAGAGAAAGGEPDAGAVVGVGVRAAARAAGADGGADPPDHRGGGGQRAVGAHDPAPLRGGGVAVEGRADRRVRWGASRRSHRNELWTGDALHGPLIDGRRTFLFCFLDDHSRLLFGYRWAAREDVLNASRALRAGIAARGVPKAVLRRQRLPFVSGQLLRACAVLGIRLIHSRPGRPEGRGKIERVFRTVREQVLVELEDHPPASLRGPQPDRSRRGSSRSITSACTPRRGRRRLSGSSPAARRTLPAERSLREAFRWSERRTVSQDRHGRDARQHLRGRPRARRPAGGADLRPARAGRGRGPRRRPSRRAWRCRCKIKRHVHPRAQPPARARRADRDRLPRPDPQAPRAGASEADRLPQPAAARRPTTHDHDHDHKESTG